MSSSKEINSVQLIYDDEVLFLESIERISPFNLKRNDYDIENYSLNIYRSWFPSLNIQRNYLGGHIYRKIWFSPETYISEFREIIFFFEKKNLSFEIWSAGGNEPFENYFLENILCEKKKIMEKKYIDDYNTYVFEIRGREVIILFGDTEIILNYQDEVYYFSYKELILNLNLLSTKIKEIL